MYPAEVSQILVPQDFPATKMPNYPGNRGELQGWAQAKTMLNEATLDPHLQSSMTREFNKGNAGGKVMTRVLKAAS